MSSSASPATSPARGPIRAGSDSIARSRRPMAAAGRGTPAALLPGLVPAAEGSLGRHVTAFGDRLDRPYPPEDDPPVMMTIRAMAPPERRLRR